MNKKDLELIIALSEVQKITQVAQAMGYSQSGVSSMLKAIENDLGFPLFFRTKKGVILTPTGEKLIPYIRSALDSHEDLKQVISSINGKTIGHIKVASYTSLLASWLPKLIRAFQKEYPLITFEIKEGGIADMINLTSACNVDMGFCSYAGIEPAYWIPLFKDDMVLIYSPDYKGIDAQRGYFPIEELARHPLIVYSESAEYGLFYSLRKTGLIPPKAAKCISTSSDFGMLSMVMHGLGISIAGKLFADAFAASLHTLPLKPAAPRELGIVLPSGKTTSPAAQAFIDFALSTQNRTPTH